MFKIIVHHWFYNIALAPSSPLVFFLTYRCWYSLVCVVYVAYNAIWNPEQCCVVRYLRCRGCTWPDTPSVETPEACIAAEVCYPVHPAQDQVRLLFLRANLLPLCFTVGLCFCYSCICLFMSLGFLKPDGFRVLDITTEIPQHYAYPCSGLDLDTIVGEAGALPGKGGVRGGGGGAQLLLYCVPFLNPCCCTFIYFVSCL